MTDLHTLPPLRVDRWEFAVDCAGCQLCENEWTGGIVCVRQTVQIGMYDVINQGAATACVDCVCELLAEEEPETEWGLVTLPRGFPRKGGEGTGLRCAK